MLVGRGILAPALLEYLRPEFRDAPFAVGNVDAAGDTQPEEQQRGKRYRPEDSAVHEDVDDDIECHTRERCNADRVRYAVFAASESRSAQHERDCAAHAHVPLCIVVVKKTCPGECVYDESAGQGGQRDAAGRHRRAPAPGRLYVGEGEEYQEDEVTGDSREQEPAGGQAPEFAVFGGEREAVADLLVRVLLNPFVAFVAEVAFVRIYLVLLDVLFLAATGFPPFAEFLFHFDDTVFHDEGVVLLQVAFAVLFEFFGFSLLVGLEPDCDKLGGALFFPPLLECLYDVRLAVVLLDSWRQCGYGVKNPDADGYRDNHVVVDLQVLEERFKRIHVYEYIL